MKRFFKKLWKNIKEFIIKAKNAIVSFASKKEYNRKQLGIISLIGVGIVVVVILVMFFVMSGKITQLERNTILDKSKTYSYYLEFLESKKKNTEDYVIFVMKYSSLNNHKSGLRSIEISELISELFDIKIDEDTIRKNGVTEKMVNENISYSPSDDTFDIITPKLDSNTIVSKPVSYYKYKKLSRVNAKKYTVVYQKYIIEDPVKVLNFYNEKNAKNEGSYDIAPYRNYIVGSDSIIRFKESINEEDVPNFAKKDKKYKVTYIVTDEKVLIDKVSGCTLC